MPKQQITTGKEWARLFSYLQGRGHGKWQETVTAKAECGLRGFQLGGERKLGLFQMCRKVTMDTGKNSRAKGVWEPPVVEGEFSAKSRLAK